MIKNGLKSQNYEIENYEKNYDICQIKKDIFIFFKDKKKIYRIYRNYGIKIKTFLKNQLNITIIK